MAFVLINKIVRGSEAVTNELRMGSKMHSGETTRSIYLAITRDVIEQIGWQMIERDKRINVHVGVLEGTGDDAGFWLLNEQDYKHGYVLGSDRASGSALSGTVALGKVKHYVLNDLTSEFNPEPVEFTVDQKDRTILVQCPDWLRYNPQSVIVPKPVPRTEPWSVEPVTSRTVSRITRKAAR